MINFDFEPVVDTTVFNRRDITQYFSYKFTSDLKLGSLITNLISPSFDLPQFERLVGWIGEEDHIDNNYYYKISESTPDRHNYQLAPFIVSIDDNDNIISAIHYLDIFNNLKSQGALTDNVNRLVRSKNKTWCPPINPDMLANFVNYIWSPFGTKIYEIHGLKYTEDQYNRSFDSEVIKQIMLDKNKFKSKIDPTEQKEYIFEYSDNLWFLAQTIVDLRDYGITYNLVSGASKPNDGDTITVEFIPEGTQEQTDITEDLIGKQHATVVLDTYVEVYDETTGETKQIREEVDVQTGMRFRFYNDKNLDYNDIVYMINGVGSAIELQDDREFGDIYEITSEDELDEKERVESTKLYNLVSTAVLYKYSYNVREWVKIENDDKGEIVFYKRNPEATEESEKWIEIEDKSLIDFSINMTPDYVTVQRLSQDFNDWSRGNRWFSILLFNNDATLYNYYQRKAVHQIIEFKRNIKLFNSGNKKVADVDCYYKGNIGALYGNINGYRVPVSNNEYDNPLMFDGMRILIKDTTSAHTSEQIWEVSGLSLGISTLSLVNIVFEDGDEVYIKNSKGVKKGLVYWKTSEFIEAQNKAVNLEENGNTYPLYELFDDEYISLENDEKYPNSSFKGSKLFGYKDNNYLYYINYMYYDLDGKNGYFKYIDTDKFANFLIESERFVESNYIQYFKVVDPTIYDYGLELVPSSIARVSINTTELTNSKYVYNPPMLSINRSVVLNENDVIKVEFKYEDEVEQPLTNAFLEVSKLVTTCTNNLDIKEIDYTVLLSQMVDIISNQEGFEGNPYSQNNFYSTAQDISIGTKLFNSYSRFNKLAIINNMNNVDVRSAIMKVAEKYEEFKRRFVQRAEQMALTNLFTIDSDITEIVKSILEYLNIGKLKGEAFYNNGVISDTSYIPATPSYLGMIPCVKPYLKEDGRTLVGHDGSETYLKFGDWRDNALIELENEIYDSINPVFKDTLGTLEYQQYISRANNQDDYSISEYNEIMSSLFSKWFALHPEETFSNIDLSDDPFTWNWSSCIDFQGNHLLGHYRGIYNYFYGTYRPDKCPWEMLGFYDKPEWWDDTYGEYPYTSNNLVMWQDIANGIIRHGANTGQYDYLKRDYLLDIIPTDEDGILLPPNMNGITSQTPIYMNAAKGFKFGDGSNAEWEWWKTSEYKYALMCGIYLMKPGFWLEYTWDTLSDKENYKLSNTIHNSVVNGEYQKVIGSAQWISDYLCLNGISISNLVDLLNHVEVKLGYRVGGYIDSGNLTIKNSKQDTLLSSYYDIITYKSAIIKSVSMSNMSIAWVDGKYIIYGSDINNPYFNVLTPDTLQNYTYDNSTKLPILYFKSWVDKGARIPYYTVVDTVQEVYNIIRGYGKYLESVGFIFQTYEDNSQVIINWDKMAKNFLAWVESSVKEDRDVLTLAPWNILNYDTSYPYSYISFRNEFGLVDNICSYTNNVWNIMDIDGNALMSEDVDIFRQQDGVVIRTKDLKQIAYIHLNVYTQENAIIFDTVQDNGFILYDEQNGEYIKNLYIESVRTAIWDGGLYAPGLILNDDKLIYNYTKRAYNFKDYYNIDSITSVEPLGIMAKSITGYARDILLNEIFANENSEFDFYNAQKLDKGSFNVIRALRRLPSMQNLDVFEMFALLEDEYGETNNYKQWEIKVQQDWNIDNPQIFTINTYKSYKEFLHLVGQPVLVNDILYSTYKEEDEHTETGYLQSETFSPYGFNWSVKIKVAVDTENDEEDIKPVITCSNKEFPSLFVEGKHLILKKLVSKQEGEFVVKSYETIISTSDLRLGDAYFVEYGWNGTEYYIILTNDNKEGNIENKKYIPTDKIESVTDIKLLIGIMKEEDSITNYWNNGRIFLSFYDNSLDANIKEEQRRKRNLIYSDSPEWIKQAEFISDNRFTKIKDESKVTFLPYIPLIKEDEVQYKIVTKDEIENLLSNNEIRSSDRILVTFDNNSWDLLQLKEVNRIKSIEYSEEVDLYQNTAVFETEFEHNFFEGELIEIKSDKEEAESWEGVQTILSVVDSTHFTIATTVQKAETFDVEHYPTISGIISRKFKNKSDLFESEEESGNQIIYTLKSSIVKPELEDIFYVEKETDTLYQVIDNERHAILYRHKEPKIDTNLIQQILVYDGKEPLQYTRYEIYDPFKYQVDLEARKNIKYLNFEDPALYAINNVTQEYSSLDNWTDAHVGEVWWDLSQCKYYDYEIEDDEYRAKMWGKLAHGSELKVYEWVKSPVAPSEYQYSVDNEEEVDGVKLSGTPLYILVDDTKMYKYNIKKEYNNETKADQLWYYFWVENTKYVTNVNKNRTLSTSSIVARLNADVNKSSWFAPISCKLNPDLSYTSSFIMANMQDMKNNDNVLQIKYELRESKLPLHKDWLFFHKSLKETKYLAHWEKFKDSLSGYDRTWKPVPNIDLNDYMKNGNKYFPRQSMIVNKKEALKSLIQKINDMLIVKNLDKSIIDKFSVRNYPVIEIDEKELYEDITENDAKFIFKVVNSETGANMEYDNYKKVINTNTIDVRSWKYADADPKEYITFDNKKSIQRPEYIVNSIYDLEILIQETGIETGSYIYVDSDKNYDYGWTIYYVTESGLELYEKELYKMTDFFEYADWYSPDVENFNVIKKTYKTVSDIEMDDEYTPVYGDLVRLTNNNADKWSIVQYNNFGWVTVANEDGTIQITDKILEMDISDPLSETSKLYALIVRNILTLFED